MNLPFTLVETNWLFARTFLIGNPKPPLFTLKRFNLIDCLAPFKVRFCSKLIPLKMATLSLLLTLDEEERIKFVSICQKNKREEERVGN